MYRTSPLGHVSFDCKKPSPSPHAANVDPARAEDKREAPHPLEGRPRSVNHPSRMPEAGGLCPASSSAECVRV